MSSSSSSSSSTPTNTSLFPLVASIGLFVATTVVSQWFRSRKIEDVEEDYHPMDREFEDLRKWYKSRRLHDRLSYENVNKAIHMEGPKFRVSDSDSLLDDSEENFQLPIGQDQRNSSTSLSSSLQGSLSDLHPNAEYDFHPKNRNWRHFEHFNEEDRRHEPNGKSSLFCELNEGEEDAKSVSSQGSGSSEEQFVWTKHQHRKDEEHESIEWRKALSLGLSQPITEGKIYVDKLPHSQRTSVSSKLRPLARSASRSLSSDDDRTEKIRHVSSAPRRTKSSPNLLAPRSLMERFWSFKNGDERYQPPVAAATHAQVRKQYNARIMPEKLVMIRHGQSMGNINELLYSTTPDNAMPLTDLGWDQARMAGKILKEKVIASGETVHFIVSPYVRTVETFHGLVSAWCDPKEFAHIPDRDKRVKAWYSRLMEMGVSWNEDSRIREQDFGNYQDPETIKKAKRERHQFGIFYYRFPHGESASDVFDRVSIFLDSLWRSFDMNRSRNYVLVTHGISIRVLLARYFRYTIDQFNVLSNPRNCEMVVLGHNGDGKLELDGRCQLETETDETTNETKVVGYNFHKRLRILPQTGLRKVKIRISPDD